MVGNCKEVHSPSGLSRMLGLFYVSLEKKKTYSKTIPQNQEKNDVNPKQVQMRRDSS
jgi:hypothetical protein